MKCKYCHKSVRSIAHFMQAHKALMLRKMHRGKGRGKHKKGSRGHRSRSGGSKTSTVGTGGYPKLTLTFHN